VIDEPLSGTRKLRLFSVAGLTVGAQDPPSDVLDKAVNEALAKHLGINRHIQFYLPSFVYWRGNTLSLAVGGQAYTENVGPLGVYCYGMQIDSESLRVKDVLSAKELKAKAGRSCEVSP
jgi:hypothetical protein